MAAKISTGLRDAILGSSSLKSALDLGFLDIYSGTPPATADAAISGTLLCRISNASGVDGVTLGTAAAGSIPKNPSEVWSGVVLATGTATYFRYVSPTDDGTLSTTALRIQGVCATAGADLNMSSVNLTAGATQTVDSGVIVLPTY